MNDLVERLTNEQPVKVSLRPETSLENFRAALERGYVHVLFTETRGGTELGVSVDEEASEVPDDVLENGSGQVHLEGTLVLDYVRVRFIGDLDVASLDGTGRLVPVGDDEASPASEAS